jgi:DNA-binding transcriptional regulator YhcF (GntR family)
VILRIDPASAVPAYEQIRAQVVRAVAAGTLRAGTQLPTIRQLAADLGLAKGTVAKAYESLEQERVVVTQGRHGTVIATSADKPSGGAAATTAALREAADTFAVAARQLGVPTERAVAVVRAALDRLG